MPAEWEPHEATWLTWPRKGGVSFPEFGADIEKCWLDIAGLLCQHEKVRINVFDEDHEAEVRDALAKGRLGVFLDKQIHLHRFPAYEPWCRDHGPIFLVRDEEPCVAVVDWKYNAWGGKYPPFDLDDDVPRLVAEHFGMPLFTPDIVLEGGSIDVNGRGSLLTTSSCLLNPNRNPSLSQKEIERVLCDYLGVTQVLWLGEGIAGDDTDGHVDDIARFVSQGTIVTSVSSEPSDPNFQPLMDNYEKLLYMKDERGKPFRICTLPMPDPIESNGHPLPASYANFYVANNVVLVPTFECTNDREALLTLKELFPGRRVEGVDARALIQGLGAIHCVTQQQPG